MQSLVLTMIAVAATLGSFGGAPTHALVADDYITENYQGCRGGGAPFSCLKYRVAKYVSQQAWGEFIKRDRMLGPIAIVKVQNTLGNATLQVLENSRQFSSDTEFDKLLKFLRRQMDTFLRYHAIRVPIPDGGIILEDDVSENEIDEERGRKKKKMQLLVPLLVLFKLFKVKVLLVVVLFGVLFIKKMLLGAALLLPSILNMLKVCKNPVVTHHDHGGGLDHGDYGGGYGGGYGGLSLHPYAQTAAAYGKDAYDRVYNAYKPQAT